MNYRLDRLHNLLLRIYKVASKEEDTAAYMNRRFTAEDLKNLYFRKSDFALIDNINRYFSEDKGEYLLTDEAKDVISEYIQQHNKYKDSDCKEDEFIKQFEETERFLNDPKRRNDDELKKRVNRMVPLATPLHWKYQPEYKEYLLAYTGQVPENNRTEFYNNFYTLEKLYWVITDNPKKKKVNSFLGDINLNKEFDFKVYTKRWSSEDVYQVSRTIEGWNATFRGVSKKGDKKGNAIIHFMKNDAINYHPYVSDLFEYIWNYADDNEVDIKIVAELMGEVAAWISGTERSTPKLNLESRW